ncbi:hypothetical protein Taro_029200, partial [Colocasia esculenta]|nr:hypothetical protein [Colocasia esculenta]
MTLVPVRLPGSSRPLMAENVAWDGYNRSVSQGACSEPFKHTFRAVYSFGCGVTTQLPSMVFVSATTLRELILE